MERALPIRRKERGIFDRLLNSNRREMISGLEKKDHLPKTLLYPARQIQPEN